MPQTLLKRANEVAGVAAQYCEEVDRDARFPHEAIRALKDARLLGVMAPPELGGEGASLKDIADVCCLLGQFCSATAMTYAMHQIKTASLVAHGLSSPWHRDFIKRLTQQQLLLASATTEAGVGGDLRNSICAVERDGEDFRLRKDASVISYGMHADAILVTARRGPEAPGSDQSLIAVLKGQFTLQKTAEWNTLGMRGTCSEGYILEARGSAAQIFPKPFAEIAAQSMLAVSHILWSSLWYGIAASAMSKAQSFVRAEARKKPGVAPPGALRIAEGASMLQLMKSGIAAALQRYESAQGAPESLTSMGFAIDMNNLKIGSSRLAVDIVNHALMVCGILGYKNDTPYSLGRQLRDVMSAPIMINNDRIFANTSNLLLMHRLDQKLTG